MIWSLLTSSLIQGNSWLSFDEAWATFWHLGIAQRFSLLHIQPFYGTSICSYLRIICEKLNLKPKRSMLISMQGQILNQVRVIGVSIYAIHYVLQHSKKPYLPWLKHQTRIWRASYVSIVIPSMKVNSSMGRVELKHPHLCNCSIPFLYRKLPFFLNYYNYFSNKYL